MLMLHASEVAERLRARLDCSQARPTDDPVLLDLRRQLATIEDLAAFATEDDLLPTEDMFFAAADDDDPSLLVPEHFRGRQNGSA